jgi:hypothetical protein
LPVDQFPPDLKRFIETHISSVAQLEALLLLRNQADKTWTAEEAAKALYTASDVVASQLSELHQRGLLALLQAPGPAFRYMPASAELEQLVNRLAEIYKERSVAVITLIYSQPVDKVRTFADAFRLRKES